MFSFLSFLVHPATLFGLTYRMPFDGPSQWPGPQPIPGTYRRALWTYRRYRTTLGCASTFGCVSTPGCVSFFAGSEVEAEFVDFGLYFLQGFPAQVANFHHVLGRLVDQFFHRVDAGAL